MPRHDLSDVTFIIPIFIDCPERLENFRTNLRHLTKLFETSVLIGEMPLPAGSAIQRLAKEVWTTNSTDGAIF